MVSVYRVGYRFTRLMLCVVFLCIVLWEFLVNFLLVYVLGYFIGVGIVREVICIVG